jgi:hypothetical protein
MGGNNMANTPSTNSGATPPKKGYGKRPVWQWIVIYLIIGGILYAGVAYWYIHRPGSGTTQTNSLY